MKLVIALQETERDVRAVLLFSTVKDVMNDKLQIADLLVSERTFYTIPHSTSKSINC